MKLKKDIFEANKLILIPILFVAFILITCNKMNQQNEEINKIGYGILIYDGDDIYKFHVWSNSDSLYTYISRNNKKISRTDVTDNVTKNEIINMVKNHLTLQSIERKEKIVTHGITISFYAENQVNMLQMEYNNVLSYRNFSESFNLLLKKLIRSSQK